MMADSARSAADRSSNSGRGARNRRVIVPRCGLHPRGPLTFIAHFDSLHSRPADHETRDGRCATLSTRGPLVLYQPDGSPLIEPQVQGYVRRAAQNAGLLNDGAAHVASHVRLASGEAWRAGTFMGISLLETEDRENAKVNG